MIAQIIIYQADFDYPLDKMYRRIIEMTEEMTYLDAGNYATGEPLPLTDIKESSRFFIDIIPDSTFAKWWYAGRPRKIYWANDYQVIDSIRASLDEERIHYIMKSVELEDGQDFKILVTAPTAAKLLNPFQKNLIERCKEDIDDI